MELKTLKRTNLTRANYTSAHSLNSLEIGLKKSNFSNQFFSTPGKFFEDFKASF